MEKEWERAAANIALVYTADQIKEFQATERIARSVYVLGNGGPTDVYTNQDTAYEIREALRAQYKNTEQWGLTTLTEKINKVVRANQYACPDIWFDSLQYYKKLTVKTGGSAKTDAKIVADVLATAPNSYDSITTLVDLTDKDILKFTSEQYRSYWKNTAVAYMVETKHNSEVNFVARGQRHRSSRPVGKLWKKFKGFCKNCGIQGHKAVNCHMAKKNNNSGQRKVQGETRNIFSVIRQDL
jgi:hypothetical protein